ncbi:MAG: heat-inducible transcription repressor HrcA [Candidatus Hydrogenedens sp.]|nr:heat-inducible transcription repressor HrcA [Candidatus Hydrogenedens sp.]
MPETPELNERERAILHDVVQSYITTAEAVGSRTVVRRFGMDLSAATVRNVMADLEELGYLQQLHTSSGRVPTDTGYQYYIRHLMKVQELTQAERARIESEFSQRMNDADDVLRQASHLLALVSHHAGLAETPNDSTAVLARMDLVKISPDRMAVLLVDNFGRVRSMIADIDAAMNAPEMEKLNNFMNDHLRGLPVDQLAGAVGDKVRLFLDEQRKLAQRALEVLMLLPKRPRGQLFLEGASQLFEQPEFQNMEQARGVFNLLEEQDQLLTMLRAAASGENTSSTVLLGGGDGRERMDGLGVVASPYRVGDRKVGMIGVLGPRRMHYSKLMSVVDYTADLVGRLLTRLGV